MNHILAKSLPSLIEPQPIAPPSASSFLTFVNYTCWGVVVVGVISLLVMGGLVIVGALEGQASHRLKGVAWVIVGLVIAASAGGIVTWVFNGSGGTPVA